MATNAPITGARTRAPLLPSFTLANRADIEQEIERLISLLDAVDGDCDIEDDDPAGDYLDLGEAMSDDSREISAVRPLWAVDQSFGPVNYREATRQRIIAELGLVRSATGGWRHSA